VLQKSTIQLLRFHFSFFLMPIFLFALSETENISISKSIIVFFVFHFLVFPASNGYNSYMDRDTESVGGIKNPMEPTKQLFWITVAMDTFALLISFYIGFYFFIGLLFFILASRAYSYRGIRLKKYPVVGYIVVIFFQGAVTFFLVNNGISKNVTTQFSILPMLASSLLIGGFYPLTQIYQHKQDEADGVKTLSSLLGYSGTFVFTAIIYFIAMFVLAIYYFTSLQEKYFFYLQLFLLPVFVYFFYWFKKVTIDNANANFTNTMRMNVLASACTNVGFMIILLIKYFE
jgi:1,4-dihydroxy-2-naphthoate polyprenyltransferase